MKKYFIFKFIRCTLLCTDWNNYLKIITILLLCFFKKIFNFFFSFLSSVENYKIIVYFKLCTFYSCFC